MAIPKFLSGLRANNKRIQDVASPSTGTDAANKDYVDSLVNGLSWKQPVRVATTANGTLATAFVNGATVDGVVLATGDRIFVKNQTTGSENGIRVVAASGVPPRAADMDSNTEAVQATAFVREGTVNSDTSWTVTNNGAIVLDTTALVIAQTGAGGSTYTADGNGIEVSANQFSLELDGASLTKGAAGLKVTTPATNNFAANCVVTTNPQTFAHGLGTADINVDVYESGSQVFPEVTVDATNVTVDWGGAPTAAQYRVVAGKQ